MTERNGDDLYRPDDYVTWHPDDDTQPDDDEEQEQSD